METSAPTTWTDRSLVLAAFALLIAFCSIVAYYVAEPDLILVFLIVLFMAATDFWNAVFRTRPSLNTSEPMEDRPAAISGKTLTGAKDDFEPDAATEEEIDKSRDI